jgi:hypothetical protein
VEVVTNGNLDDYPYKSPDEDSTKPIDGVLLRIFQHPDLPNKILSLKVDGLDVTSRLKRAYWSSYSAYYPDYFWFQQPDMPAGSHSVELVYRTAAGEQVSLTETFELK